MHTSKNAKSNKHMYLKLHKPQDQNQNKPAT